MYQYVDYLTENDIRKDDEFIMVDRDKNHYWPYVGGGEVIPAKFIEFVNERSLRCLVKDIINFGWTDVVLSRNVKTYGPGHSWGVKRIVKDYKADQIADEAEDLL